jgi:hypothetical protein
MTDMHTCSYYCDRPNCIKRQRDELREALFAPKSEAVSDLLVRLKDVCQTPGGVGLDGRAEPWGCDVGLIREAIAAIQAAVSAPDGWQLVPRKMTIEMSIAFAEVWFSRTRAVDDDDMQDAYDALLAASTQPECLDCAYNPGCCDTHD